RFFGISTPINSTAGQKEFKQLAQELIVKEQPGTFNQAIMEFGARYCVPQSSDCENCIFNDSCVAFQQKKVAQLPVKIKSKPVKQRFFNYLVILSENERTVLQQRNGKGIWHKLYEFPLIETSKEIEVSELQELPQFQDFSEKMNIRNISLYNQEAVVHKLSHQHLNTRFWIIETLDETESSVAISEIESYAVPVLIANFVSEFFENY
ncbi:MAG TPA: A/G-specific adenine glycosylase, partial [Aequorivita sp.]|nr:A/G-specific adenine glycosylase [Aequorivita sp.]